MYGLSQDFEYNLEWTRSSITTLLQSVILKSENSVSTNIYLTKVCWTAGKKQGFTSHFVIETDWGPLHMSPVEQETGCACYHES